MPRAIKNKIFLYTEEKHQVAHPYPISGSEFTESTLGSGALQLSILSSLRNSAKKLVTPLLDDRPVVGVAEIANDNHAFEAVSTSQEHHRPRPLVSASGEPGAFPTDALGSVLGAAALAIADLVQAPEAVAGTAVLAAATLAVQAHGDIRLPSHQIRPVSNLFVSIALSGDRKSSVDNYATRPIFDHQLRLAESYELARADFESAVADGATGMTKPRLPLIVAEDPTPEGLYRALREGQPTLGLFTDEGGRFLGGYGMSADHRLKTAGMISNLWDGKPISKLRGGDVGPALHGRRMSMHIMVQPAIAGTLFGDQTMREQGLLSRILVTAPASLMGTRPFRVPSPTNLLQVDRYSERLGAILAEAPTIGSELLYNLAPRVLPLSPEAIREWVAFYNEVEKALRSGGELSPISGLGSKLAEHSGRIAGVLALSEDLFAGSVERRHVEAGISLARHYCDEALRLFQASTADEGLKAAARLGNWLLAKHNGKDVPLKHVYQFGPKESRSAEAAKQALVILEDHGWIVWQRAGGGGAREKGSSVFWVVPQDAALRCG